MCYRLAFVLFIVFTAPIGLAQIQPEPSSGIKTNELVTAKNFMAVSANPYASMAGKEILQKGGSAIDAAIAMQMVLNVVEPQSSGIGGGGFLLYFDSKKNKITSYDGRETAPKLAKPTMFFDNNSKPLPFFDAVQSGLSVGTPGLLKMLEMVHNEHGIIAWKDLFTPAIDLAQNGFPLSQRLYTLINSTKNLSHSRPAADLFFSKDNKAKPVGTVIQNPELVKTFTQIADEGSDIFYHGQFAKDISKLIQTSGGKLAASDLADYQAKIREPICGGYHTYKICGMGPPSSGAITVLQTLGILEYFDLFDISPMSAKAVHLITEASKLAFADRNYYIADSDFVAVPVEELIDHEYLRQRAALINTEQASGKAIHGKIFHRFANVDNSYEPPSTTHISVVDALGNVVSMTTSIEHAFGSTLMTGGFLLNNQLTDFSFVPIRGNKQVANNVQAGKRPRSSMAPTVVFDDKGFPVLVIGSPGGARIIPYVVKTIIATLDWKMNIQDAINQPHFVNMNGKTQLEKGQSLKTLGQQLEAMGHNIEYRDLTSGLHGITIDNKQLYGGADPRREGVAIGG